MLFWYFLTRCEFHSWPTGCRPLHSLSSYFHFVQNFKWALNCMKQDLIVGCIPHSCRKFFSQASQPARWPSRPGLDSAGNAAGTWAGLGAGLVSTDRPAHALPSYKHTNRQMQKYKYTNTLELALKLDWTDQPTHSQHCPALDLQILQIGNVIQHTGPIWLPKWPTNN